MASEVKKLKVAVDLDGTLAQTNQRMVELIQADFSLDICLDDFKEWEWWKTVPPFDSIYDTYGPAAAERLIWRYYAIAWWNPEKIAEMPGAIDGMFALKEDKRFQYGIVSQRQLNSTKDIIQWLKSWCIPFDYLTVIDTFSKSSKADLDYDIYIDDSPNLAVKVFLKPGARMILMDGPWNRDFEDSKVVKRAESWKDVPALLDIFWHDLTWTPY